ncbi:MAG TPA: PsiF family protein [Advenella sp.]|nr:PsiF family protein [Advenella sp.]
MNIVSKSACAAAIAASLLCTTALAQTATPAKKENSQQTRMTTCNADAKTKNLQGDARKQFMKTCLSHNSTTKDGKPLTRSQQRMTDCNKDATSQNLTGEARKSFMSGCLKKS